MSDFTVVALSGELLRMKFGGTFGTLATEPFGRGGLRPLDFAGAATGRAASVRVTVPCAYVRGAG